MPSWDKIRNEIVAEARPHEIVRRRYLAKFHGLTGRNVILYYSGWMQKPGLRELTVIDNTDMNGFMSLISDWNAARRKRGLDLILHTPGGKIAATESLGNYLRAMFHSDIRVFVPQMAMSCGTMLACAGKSVVMGKHSSLGPIDPQFGGVSARWVLEDLLRARDAIDNDPANIHVWTPIVSKYPLGAVSRFMNAIDWAKQMTREWLEDGMFEGRENKAALAETVVSALGVSADASISDLAKAHERQLSPAQCREIGLEIEALEDNPDIQDAVLSIHHACIWALAETKMVKIMENHMGSDFVRTVE